MKKYLAIMLLFVSSIAMASQSQVLFLQTASLGSLVKNNGDHYTLTLVKFPPYVGYFTNRPQRKVGIISVKEFVDLWKNKSIKDNFSKVPPNVAFVIKPPVGQPQNFIAEVYDPVYVNNTLTYKLRIIGSKPSYTGGIVHLNAFFDDIPWNPGGL